MSGLGADQERWVADADSDVQESSHWPADWRELLPLQRWLWFERLWQDTCRLHHRYRLPIRAGWWEDHIQIEALAALAAWVERYDGGEWDDPPGKLALLYDLERIGTLLRDGSEPFNPDRDRARFVRYLFDLGCESPRQP